MRVAFVVLACLFATTFTDAEPRPDSALINTLDRTFQSRFETIDMMAFGMRRIPVTPKHEEFNRFSPENSEDRRITDALNDSGWEAAFFIAGRRALRWATTADDPQARVANAVRVPAGESDLFWEHPVSKPIRLNPPSEGTAPLPTRSTMLPHVVQAFRHFAAKKASLEFKESDWLVVARPVPASKRACLGCHEQDESGKPLKVGDALGVAFYAFARAGEGKPQQAVESAQPKPRQSAGSLR